ncbi:hypothetical protein MQX03_15600 [Chryseobacterium aahli]|nr:hypothetical protein [Chryseobacterium aahli]
MIEVLGENIPASVINNYSEKHFLYDKNKFLNSFKTRAFWGILQKDDVLLVDFLISKYDSAVLKDFFSKNLMAFGSGKFARLVLDRMKD